MTALLYFWTVQGRHEVDFVTEAGMLMHRNGTQVRGQIAKKGSRGSESLSDGNTAL